MTRLPSNADVREMREILRAGSGGIPDPGGWMPYASVTVPDDEPEGIGIGVWDESPLHPGNYEPGQRRPYARISSRRSDPWTERGSGPRKPYLPTEIDGRKIPTSELERDGLL